MISVLLIMLSIISCSDSELKMKTPDLQKEPANILNQYISLRFLGFETADQLIVVQLPVVNDYKLDTFSKFNQLITKDYEILLLSDTEEFSIAVTDESENDLIVNGIIRLTKSNNSTFVLSEYIELLNDLQDINCWSGGEGTKSCSTMYRGPEINVTCKTSYFACCNQDMTGLCIAY